MLRFVKQHLLCVAALTVVAAFAVPGFALAAGSYPDAAGDGHGAPDIRKVDVAVDANGQLLFTIQVEDLPSPADVRTALFLNTDMNGDTGAPDTAGADFVFLVDESDNSYWFAAWNGSEWGDTPSATVHVSSDRSGVLVSVNRSELGNTSEFNFWARTRAGDMSANQSDDAPNLGVWNFSVAANGPDIVSVLVQVSPLSGPKAGKLFRINPLSIRLPSSGESTSVLPAPERYSCTATLAGRRLPGTGAGGCTWTVPPKTKGKRLAVIVSVTYLGSSKSVPMTYTVR